MCLLLLVMLVVVKGEWIWCEGVWLNGFNGVLVYCYVFWWVYKVYLSDELM